MLAAHRQRNPRRLTFEFTVGHLTRHRVAAQPAERGTIESPRHNTDHKGEKESEGDIGSGGTGQQTGEAEEGHHKSHAGQRNDRQRPAGIGVATDAIRVGIARESKPHQQGCANRQEEHVQSCHTPVTMNHRSARLLIRYRECFSMRPSACCPISDKTLPMSLTDQLSSIELFSQLSAKELKKIASFMTPISIKPGRDLTVQGKPGREFMIIAEGEASVRRNGRLIATLGPGDFFGELAVIAGVPRTATVTAETEMVVEALNRREFSSLLDESPSIAKKVLVGAVKRLHDIEEGVVR